MRASSTTTHTMSAREFTLDDLREFLKLCERAAGQRAVRISVTKGDRPNGPDTFSLSATLHEVGS